MTPTALSDATIRNAKPQDKQYKLYDEGGLFLIVRPSGGKPWRLKYRVDGKELQLTIGTYPEVGLKDARIKRDEARKLLASGSDPAAVLNPSLIAISTQRVTQDTCC